MTWQTDDGFAAGRGELVRLPMTPGDVERLRAAAERRVAVPPATVRIHLLRVIRDLNFELKNEQFSLLEAIRGSRLGSLTLSPSRVPVALRIDFDPDADGAVVVVRLEDRWPGPVGRNWGATAAYTDAFAGTLGAVDAALARLDPDAAASFSPWLRSTGSGDVAAMRNAATAAARAGAVVSKGTSRIFDGTQPAQPRATAAAKSGAAFTFTTPDKVAELDAEAVDGMLTAGTLVAGRPGDMPPALVSQVQAMVVTIEEHIANVPPGSRYVNIPVSQAQMPVLTFLRQQSRLREKLPLRTLRICTTCRLEKTINPDYERIMERSRRTKLITGSVGAVFGTRQISPYVLVGRLLQLKKTDPDFACPRCQGMDADETLITFCPQCGDRRAESALRACTKCRFDLRSLLSPEELWRYRTPAPQLPGQLAELPGPPAAPAPPAPTAPPAAPHGQWPAPSAPLAPDDPASWPRPPV